MTYAGILRTTATNISIDCGPSIGVSSAEIASRNTTAAHLRALADLLTLPPSLLEYASAGDGHAIEDCVRLLGSLSAAL